MFLWKIIIMCKRYFNKPKASGIMIIRLDSIGDYILFRNFLPLIKQSSKFQHKNITLLGNIAWREIAEEFDNKIIDKFVWIDPNKLQKSIRYRLFILFELAKYKFEFLISPTYSREFGGLDSLVYLINATIKIGSIGDVLNKKTTQIKFCDKVYTQLIPAKKNIMFEFERNREFFETLLDTKLRCELKIVLGKHSHSKFKDYVVLFVGASTRWRRWRIENFM